jgi:hypothetical protein
MIGCGPDEDPHDYFTSFFSRSLVNENYRPFYYTALLNFYDDYWMYGEEETNYENDPILQEWKNYCGKNISTGEVKNFIYDFKKPVVDKLLQSLTNSTVLTLPDSVRKNGMTNCLLAKKDEAALRYLSFAKEVEKFSWTENWDNAPVRDSLELNKYIAEANEKMTLEKNSFLKEKYAFQLCKLAFYNNRFIDCVKWVDIYFTTPGTSAVYPLALSYKAGSYFRQGRKKEAAYEFSRAFVLTDFNKTKIFLGFLWATDYCNKELEDEYAALAKTPKEKANLIGMFGLHGTSYRILTMQKVFQLDAFSPLLPLLALREINKIEEQYLTPSLEKEKGGKPYYLSWVETDSLNVPELNEIIQFFETVAKNKIATDPGLFITGAAYLAFIKKDYIKAKALIAQAKTYTLSDKLNNQLQLIDLLVMANEPVRLNAEVEKQILSPIQWLTSKAKADETYEIFYRNIFSQIIAQKYEQQKNIYRAALAYGVADAHLQKTNKEKINYCETCGEGLEFVRNEMSTENLLSLYELYSKQNKAPYEVYLLQNTSFTRNQVIDVIATSYLRDFNFEKAIEWLKKTNKPELLVTETYNYKTDKTTILNVDPLYDYLNDWQRYSKTLPKPYNKLQLAQKLNELQKKADTTRDTEARSKLYYQLGSALYNMSYYGNSWNVVAYYRTSSDWNTGDYEIPWKKEYYGVYKAKDYYQKAHDLSKNKEFKAAAFFMMVKCLQRQIPAPTYNYDNWEQYEKQRIIFQQKFKNNPFFNDFVNNYGTTKFYTYTFNRCSYLRDFVKNNLKKK